MKCENCKSKHDATYGSGRFCSVKCARGFSTKANRSYISNKVSKTIRRKIRNGEYDVSWGDSSRTAAIKAIKLARDKRKKTQRFDTLSETIRREILFEEQAGRCKLCNLKIWRGLPITLHYDHVNGNHGDNRKRNSRLICPNCHSQTHTYCGRNKGKTLQVSDKELIKALKTQSTIRKALLSVGMAAKGNNYVRAKNLMARMRT